MHPNTGHHVMAKYSTKIVYCPKVIRHLRNIASLYKVTEFRWMYSLRCQQQKKWNAFSPF